MKDKIKKLQTQKVLQEYNLLNTDYELKDNVIQEHKEEFLKKTFREKDTDENEKPNISKTEKEKIIHDSEINSKTKSKIKKIYREIVKQTHPDKMDSEVLNGYYLDATKAYDSNDILELYIICEKLDINIEISDVELDLFNKLIEIKKEKIDVLKNSFIWVWINSKTEEERKDIEERYITFCRNNR
tara:strand:+ start:2953 stop:3510 length:558 start_codon:yes stop_codon:yes gene_type:complete